MDDTKLLELIDTVVAEDREDKRLGFKRLQEFWTNLRGILVRIIPMAESRLPKSTSEKAIELLLRDPQIAKILNSTVMEICRHDKEKSLDWNIINHTRYSGTEYYFWMNDYTFGAKSIKISPYGAKGNQVESINLIMVVHASDLFCNIAHTTDFFSEEALPSGEMWVDFFLGGNKLFRFSECPHTTQALRHMAARTLANYFKANQEQN
jgi:hypothetical protein